MCPSNSPTPISNSVLHHRILKHFVECGYAPSVGELSTLLGQTRDAVVAGLRTLQDYHGVVLHPGSSEVWVIHPFSSAPTNYLDEGWTKWSAAEAKALFERFNLSGPTWDIPATSSRF